MKKYKKLSNLLISIILLCTTFTSLAASAVPPTLSEENYIDIEIPFVQTRARSPLTGNFGPFNMFFNPGQTTTTSPTVIIDWKLNTIPSSARVTRVEVSLTRINVAGVSYFVQVGKGSAANNITWTQAVESTSTVVFTQFNGQHPADIWALRFYATRTIVPPDFGVTASILSATLRVYFN